MSYTPFLRSSDFLFCRAYIYHTSKVKYCNPKSALTFTQMPFHSLENLKRGTNQDWNDMDNVSAVKPIRHLTGK